jgi:rhodanese-related sulfurtransferase
MKTLIAALLSMLVATAAAAAQYNYMAPEELKQRINSNDNILIVDIQVEEEFRQHHIPGSLATYAYPVKSSEQLTRLDPIFNLQQNDSTPVVIVCPRGAGGAKRTYDYLTANGILEDRLWILEKGMSGWKFEDMTTTLN